MISPSPEPRPAPYSSPREPYHGRRPPRESPTGDIVADIVATGDGGDQGGALNEIGPATRPSTFRHRAGQCAASPLPSFLPTCGLKKSMWGLSSSGEKKMMGGAAWSRMLLSLWLARASNAGTTRLPSLRWWVAALRQSGNGHGILLILRGAIFIGCSSAFP